MTRSLKNEKRETWKVSSERGGGTQGPRSHGKDFGFYLKSSETLLED